MNYFKFYKSNLFIAQVDLVETTVSYNRVYPKRTFSLKLNTRHEKEVAECHQGIIICKNITDTVLVLIFFKQKQLVYTQKIKMVS